MRQGRSAGPGRTEIAERAGFFWDLDAADGRKFDSCGDAERLSLKLRIERFGVPRPSFVLFEPLPNLPSRPPAALPPPCGESGLGRRPSRVGVLAPASGRMAPTPPPRSRCARVGPPRKGEGNASEQLRGDRPPPEIVSPSKAR